MNGPKKPISLRLSGEGLELMAALAKKNGVNRTAVIEMAVRRMAIQDGVGATSSKGDAQMRGAAQSGGDDDADLTDADRAAIREGIERGLDAFEAGRHRKFAEFAAEQEARFNLPPSQIS